MSMRYRGGYISATLPTVTGQQSTPGSWTLSQQMQYQAAGTWPAAPFSGWSQGATALSSNSSEPVFDSSGNVYFTQPAGAGTIRVIKFNSSGTKQWENTYYFATTYTSTSYPKYGAVLSNGDVVFVGIAYKAYYYVPVVWRIASSGTLVSCKYYDPSSSANPTGIAVDGSDNIYIAYNYNGYVVLAKLNPSTLAVVWTKNARGSAQNTNLAVSSDGTAIYLTGYDTSRPFIHKYDSSGNLSTPATITASGGTSSATYVGGISVDSSNNVFYTFVNGSYSYVVKSDSTLTAYSWVYRMADNSNGVNAQYSKPDGGGGAFFGNAFGYISNIGQYFTNISRFSSGGTTLFSNAITGYSNYQIFSVDMAQQSIYVATSNTVYATGCIFQKLPITGSGLGIYAGGNAYFPYTGGNSFTATTMTLSTYVPVTTTITATETAPTVTTASGSTTFTTTAFSYPLSSGSALYSLPGTYTWIAPSGVTSVSALCIGGGGGGAGGNGGSGGGGGGLAYKNSISVTAGTGYTVVVGAGGTGAAGGTGTYGTAGGQSSFNGTGTVYANGGGGGGSYGGPGGSGGSGGGSGATFNSGGTGGVGYDVGGGGGGAAGYAGNGGAGGGSGYNQPGASGSGGGGGGNYSGNSSGSGYTTYWSSGGVGGSVGVLGQGSSGGGTGGVGSATYPLIFGAGGYGGGWEFTACPFCPCSGNASYYAGGTGFGGGVRIMWGTSRSFPSSNASTP